MSRVATGRLTAHALAVSCFAALMLAGSPHRLAAQIVTGTVRITGTTAAATGVAVVLLDSAGTVVRGILTRADGRFTLHAPGPGIYRVRARRIGYSPDSSAVLRLDGNRPASVDLNLKHFAAALGGVNVSEKSRCAITPAAGSLALQLWEDVQSALTAAVITESGDHTNDALLTRFTREIDPVTGRVRRSTSWQMVGSRSQPYSALPADSLAARGFVVNEGQDVVYYAPDARTLLSDAFARTHCFRPLQDGSHASLIGLAFAPVRHENIGQVSGALWLDNATRELRYLEFRYTSPSAAARVATDNSMSATGRIDYQKLPQGNWIVSRWLLRVPIVEMREARTISHVGSVDLGVGATLTPTRVAHLQSLWEIGGDARMLTDSSATNTINAETSIIDGQVVTSPDSDSSTPGVAGLQVQLLATIDTAGQATRSSVTTPDGEFTFDNLTPGDYVLRITSPSLDTIALMIPDRPMHIDRATKLTVTTTLPSITSARRALCGTDVQRGDMVIRGTVRDHTTGKPLSGATVKGYWYDAMNTDQNFSAHAQTAATMTEIDGKYALCIRAARGTLHLSASLGNRKVRDQRLESAPGRIRMLDFIM